MEKEGGREGNNYFGVLGGKALTWSLNEILAHISL